jgi:hypothetical protein
MDSKTHSAIKFNKSLIAAVVSSIAPERLLGANSQLEQHRQQRRS